MVSNSPWRFLVAILFGGGLLVSAALVLGQSCGDKGDWRDINVLPTNGQFDKNIKITLSVNRTSVEPGDEIVLTFEADKDCYLTIMDMGTSGSILRLWPNQYSGDDNFVPAGSPRQFPGPQDGFKYRVGLPPGVERIIAYATTKKGRILSEQEFQTLQSTGFKRYLGGARELAKSFSKNSETLDADCSWGTAQVNVCIGGTAVGTPVTPSPSVPATNGAKGTTYVLSVGAATEGLKYCDQDARSFLEVLVTKMGVSRSNAKLLVGPEASYDGFVRGLQWLASKTQPEDTAVIFFSGHGSQIPDQAPLDETERKDECFVLYHAGKVGDWRSALKQKALMVDDEFNVLAKKIPARKRIVVVDACHSGTISKVIGTGPASPLVSKYLPLLDPETGKEIGGMRAKAVPTSYGNDNEALLSACLDNQSSYEDEGKKAGLFTHYLLEAIRKGATDLEEAFKRAKAATEKDSRDVARQFGGKASAQTPQLTDPHGYVKLFKFSK